MGKLERFLKRLDRDERETLEKVLHQIERGDFANLDVKKLKGGSGLFRVRKGSIRIVFLKDAEVTRLVSVERRSKDTYKNL